VENGEEGNTCARKPTGLHGHFPFLRNKTNWCSFVQRYIKPVNEKNHPKTIQLKIFIEHINNYAYWVTVAVTSPQTLNDIINKSLSILGYLPPKRITNCRSVLARNMPSTLIGHEYPHGIKMRFL
jgi:hypothetical protein